MDDGGYVVNGPKPGLEKAETEKTFGLKAKDPSFGGFIMERYKKVFSPVLGWF